MTNFYNAENRLNGVRLPSGVALTNHYDFAGRLTNRSSTIGETAGFRVSSGGSKPATCGHFKTSHSEAGDS